MPLPTSSPAPAPASDRRTAWRWAAVVLACFAVMVLAAATLAGNRNSPVDPPKVDAPKASGEQAGRRSPLVGPDSAEASKMSYAKRSPLVGSSSEKSDILYGRRSPLTLPAPPEATEDDAVESALAFIDIAVTGFVGIPLDDGTTSWSDEVVYYTNCTGFALTPDGDIATAGHCLEYDDGFRESLIVEWLDGLVAEGAISSEEAEAYYAEALETASVAGDDGGDPVLSTTVYIDDQVLPARIEESQPIDRGGDDAGLLNVSPENDLPTMTVAQDNPEVGTDVVSVGFPAVTSESYTGEPADRPSPSYKEGSVSSIQSYQGAEFIELSAGIGGGMSGGPTIDAETHEVLGINSYGSNQESDFNFITSTATVRDMMERHGILQDQADDTAEPATTGSSPGSGTDAGSGAPAGGRTEPSPTGNGSGSSATVLVVVAVVMAAAFLGGVVLLTRSRRRPETPAPAPSPGFNPVWPGGPQ